MLSVFHTAGGFSLGKGGDAVFDFMPAKIEMNGKELTLDAHVADGALVSEGHDLRVTDELTDLGDGLWRIDRVIENVGVGTLCFKDILEIRTAFKPAKYLIPCVNYNGKPGGGNYPHGFAKDGKPWIFAYDRTGIPSCLQFKF